jgi:hypothetical protein
MVFHVKTTTKAKRDWRYYFKRRHVTQIPVINLRGISGICLIMMATSIWSLFHSR